jgi:hypothetical protein
MQIKEVIKIYDLIFIMFPQGQNKLIFRVNEFITLAVECWDRDM